MDEVTGIDTNRYARAFVTVLPIICFLLFPVLYLFSVLPRFRWQKGGIRETMEGRNKKKEISQDVLFCSPDPAFCHSPAPVTKSERGGFAGGVIE